MTVSWSQMLDIWASWTAVSTLFFFYSADYLLCLQLTEPHVLCIYGIKTSKGKVFHQANRHKPTSRLSFVFRSVAWDLGGRRIRTGLQRKSHQHAILNGNVIILIAYLNNQGHFYCVFDRNWYCPSSVACLFNSFKVFFCSFGKQ